MHLDTIDWIIIGSYLLVSLLIGFYFRKQAGKSLSDFFLGGRNMGWFLAGTSMIATTFAADTPLAVTELVGRNGISGNWLWWNFLIGGMLTTFFFARYWRRAGVLTEVELIELRYGGRPAAFLRGFKALYLGLLMNCLIIGWVNLALASLIQVFFDVSFSHSLLFVSIAMIITAVYSALSGLKGVVVTDMIQFFIALSGCIILAVLVVNSEQIGGMAGLKNELPSWSMKFFPDIGDDVSSVAGTLTISIGAFLAYTTIQWWASWYPGAEPGGGGYIAQRMMSTKDERKSIFATLYFQIGHYCIRPWPWIIVGLCCIVLYPDLGPDEKRLGFVMAMKDFLPPGLKGMFLVAFLAAYMSTISTQLNWGSSYIINDLFGRFAGKRNERSNVTMARVVTFLIMGAGLYVTTLIETISGVWSFIIECGAGLGLVLILRWYWWRINAWSEITATIAPFIGYSISRFVLNVEFPNSFFITVAFTTVTWIVATFITKPESGAVLERFYSKVRPAGAWGKVIKDHHAHAAENGKLKHLFICWVSAIIATYSTLFFTGSVIFGQWNNVLLYGISGVISFSILRYAMSRSEIFVSGEQAQTKQ
jgi:Na+/proline symporter